MRQILTGGAYTAHSVISAAQRSVNLYSEPIPEGLTEPAKAADYPTPGLRLLGAIGTGPIRGIRQATGGNVYVVSGSEVYHVNATNWTGSSLGTITAGIKTPVSMSDNTLNLVIVDGSANGWTVNLASNSFNPLVQSGTVTPATPTTTEPVQADITRYTKFTPTFDGSIMSVTVSLATGYTGKMKCAVFDSAFKELIAAPERTNPASGINTFNFEVPTSVIAGTDYWLGFDSDTGAGAWNVDGGTIGRYSVTPYAAFPANAPAVTAATAVVCTLAMESDPGSMFVGADRVDYVDGYLTFNKPATPQFYISLFQSVTFDRLSGDFANKGMYSDLLMTQIVAKRELWLIGEKTTEVWYDQGATDIALGSFPFAPVQSVFIDHGTNAKYSVASYDNGVLWLTRDRAGQGFVVLGSGYQTKRVSTYAIEAEIAGYTRISDAIGFCYQLAGHTFYVLTFPHADKTWAYDITTGLWHEWVWLDVNGEEHRHRANCFATVNDLGVVGDWQNGNLYALDRNVFTDNGQPIKRVRTFPHILQDGKRVFYRQFLADLETGTSSAVAPATFARISASFTAPDGTALEDYTSEVGGGWTPVGGEATGVIVDDRLIGIGGDALYRSAATLLTPDYSVRFSVVPSDYDTVVADTALGVIGRAAGTGTGYRVMVTADGTQYTLTLDVVAEGGIPDWVPEGAVTHIDFLGSTSRTSQGRAWTATSGVVGIDTLLGNDPNTVNAWGISAYDAMFLTVDGYNNPEKPVAFIGEARTRITDAATLTYKLKQLGGGGLSAPVFVVVSADGNDALEIDLREVEHDVVGAISSWNGEPEVLSPPVINIGAGASNMAAVTITATRFESSYNGCAPVVYPVTEAGRPPDNPLVAALLDIVASGGAGATVSLQSITIYDPLPDTSGLSDLSALGAVRAGGTRPTPMTVAPVSVPMGTITSGIYTVWLEMSGTVITAQVQRSQDGLWLRDDATWQASSGVTAARLTDGTYTAPGGVMIGGTWPTPVPVTPAALVVTGETPIGSDPNFPSGYSYQLSSFGGPAQTFDFTSNLYYAAISHTTTGGIAITDLSTMTVLSTHTMNQMYAGTAFGSPAGTPWSQDIWDLVCGNDTDLYMLTGSDYVYTHLARIDPATMKVTGEFYISTGAPPPIKNVTGHSGAVNRTATHTILAYRTNPAFGLGPMIFDGTNMAPIGMAATPTYSAYQISLMPGAVPGDFIMLNWDTTGGSGNIDIWRIHVSDALVLTSVKTGTLNILPIFAPGTSLQVCQANYDVANDAIILWLSTVINGPPIYLVSANFTGTVRWTQGPMADVTTVANNRGQSNLIGTTLMIGSGSAVKMIDTDTGAITFTGTAPGVTTYLFQAYDAARTAYWTYVIATLGFTRVDFIPAVIPPTLAMDDVVATIAAPLSSNLISLRYSDDRAHSWGNSVSQSIGEVGEYRTSLQWQRLGYARDRTFELSWSVAMPTALQGCWIDVTPAQS